MTDLVLVTGATGQQGGIVARRLLADGVPVRALVRRPESEAARAIAAEGVELVVGDLTDRTTLGPALSGVRAVFSLQTPDLNDLTSDVERIGGLNLIEAAREAGVEQFVHSSVSGLAKFLTDAAAGRAEAWGSPHYWHSKAAVGLALPEAGFQSWTEFRPAFFATNLVRPSIWFEAMTGETILTAIDADKPLAVVAPQDIGSAVAAALADPGRFHEQVIELAGERLSLKEMAAALTAAGEPARAETVTPEEGTARGMLGQLMDNQVGMNNREDFADPAVAAAFGIPLTSFAAWAEQH
ncbi:NAD-dependent epimerase/dehydratase family protein [Kribbella antibiotica]|uniref:NAD-dependent epimerase/dehydratase family protein n=1 Tax=Kribbella antibiotica TaxID=190195 RepID=A0A4R4ZVY3_9ACTN|nr:NmrA family NAD(P)-binding protein [Kribbella antibiotica]TDD62690.1 NAD-dependent epimerase/dehydratase family protein [Kribbella antibiotica]